MADERRSHGSARDMTPSLLLRLRGGDVQAGAMLDQLYRKPMICFCWGYLGSIQDAEDAVQDVFCKVLRTPEIPDNFRAWLYKVARNHCLNARRGRARRREAELLPPDSQLDADWTGNLTRLVRQEQRSRVMHLLGALPLEQREVLRLRYADGLSRDEIAYVLESPESLVKSRLFEGLKKLREHSSLLEDH